METGNTHNTGTVGDMAELNQEDEYRDLPLPTVRVDVDGPVQVHLVPSVTGGSRSYADVASTGAQRVANADPRRRSVTLMSIDEDFYVGTSQQEAESGYGALWPKLVPLPLTHQEEVYVRAAQNTSTISVLVENWAN